jgi:hypothetical protein
MWNLIIKVSSVVEFSLVSNRATIQGLSKQLRALRLFLFAGLCEFFKYCPVKIMLLRYRSADTTLTCGIAQPDTTLTCGIAQPDTPLDREDAHK